MNSNNDKQVNGTESQEKQTVKDTASGEKTLKAAEKSRRREEKCNKEQQRRNALNDGLDVLLDLVFIIDPQLKLQAEQRARTSPWWHEDPIQLYIKPRTPPSQSR